MVVDAGAAEALSNRGRSLLSVGVLEVRGDFDRGATVALLSGCAAGPRVALGRVAYSSEEIRAAAGLRSKQVARIIDHADDREPGVVMRKHEMILC